MPPIEEYEKYLKKIWTNRQLTNQGPLLQEFEQKMRERIGLDRFQFVTNGTLALQLAIHAAGVGSGEVITTPFSYVATTSSILWEHTTPIFVDIDPDTLCIDPGKIEEAITPKTKAILAVHVFGRPCPVEAIETIAKRHKLKVIYDAAHAFGVTYKGKSLLRYGDISTCSFHATKLFHTIEGGGVIANTKELDATVELAKRFGHNGDEHIMLGINAKASEFQAAMGLCNLNHLVEIISERKKLCDYYDKLLGTRFGQWRAPENVGYNYAYYPIIFESETRLKAVMKRLAEQNIYPRRYFYPSLNELPYLSSVQTCPVSEDIAKRIICLPLYLGLSKTAVERVATAIIDVVKHGK